MCNARGEFIIILLIKHLVFIRVAFSINYPLNTTIHYTLTFQFHITVSDNFPLKFSILKGLNSVEYLLRKQKIVPTIVSIKFVTIQFNQNARKVEIYQPVFGSIKFKI